MGRPRLHDGDVAILVRLDKRLLDLIDGVAKSEGIPRNTVITRELAKSFARPSMISDIRNQGADHGGT